MANRVICRDRVDLLTVTCVRGAAWITWRGSGDVVLEPGQTIEVRRARAFCVELLKDGEVLLGARAVDAGEATAGVPPVRSSSAA